ncbi:MAG: hypothetical protein H0U74_18855 [Bradymonadaceae bacterium]|nr:hypothetical protein [Lujinxingiaceae bacterium]
MRKAGDLVRERWDQAPKRVPHEVLVERRYDALGRQAATTDYNLGLLAERRSPISSAQARIEREFDYDAVGRVTREAIGFGGGALHETFSHIETSAAGTLSRTLAYPQAPGWAAAGTIATRHHDRAGRLARISGQMDVHPLEADLFCTKKPPER